MMIENENVRQVVYFEYVELYMCRSSEQHVISSRISRDEKERLRQCTRDETQCLADPSVDRIMRDL